MVIVRARSRSPQAGGDGGLGQQVEVAQRVRRVAAAGRVDLGVVDGAQGSADLLGGVVPQLQGALQQPQLLGVGVPAAGLDGGVEDGGQRLGGVVGVVPVAGQPGGALVGADQRGVGLQGLGVAAVEAGALAGQQVVADGLADQGVPEAVAVAVLGGEQDVGADGGRSASMRSSSASPATAASSSYSTVEPPSATIRATRWASSGSASTRTSSRSRRESVRPVRQPSRGAGEFLDEEGVAVGALEDVVDLGRFGLGARGSRRSGAPTSARLKRASSMRRTVRSRSSSARKGRSGWRRWMSSER